MSFSTAGAPAGSSASKGSPDDGGAGSVMSQMLALFAPPGRDAKRGNNPMLNPRPVELHPYFKRPGKGHNHDCCDACGEGGDLICCDNCPASFHFSCHAPPLEEEDIPKGDWICLRCYVREQGRLEAIKAAGRSMSTATPNASPALVTVTAATTASTPSGNGSSDTEDVATPCPSDTAQVNMSGGKGRGRPTRGIAAKKQLEAALKAEKEKLIKIYKLKYDKYLIPKPTTNSPFDILIAATQVVNAEQFKLPSELEAKESFPFSWKWSDERQDDYDQCPKTCTVCHKTSRNIPSIGCDFCPCIFHLDCLDPPLSDIPKERWMCPNHVENFIDSQLVTSTSLSERIRLWKKHARENVDPESVRVEFLRKARSGKLFQRSRIRTPMECRIKVPQNIKDQYRLPLPGYSHDSNITRTIETSQKEGSNEEFISQLISLQTSVLRHQNRDLLGERQQKSKKTKKSDDKVLNSLGESENIEENENSKRAASPARSDDTASNCSFSAEDDDDDEDGLFSLGSDLHERLREYLAKHKSKGVNNISPLVRNLLALQRIKEIFPDRNIDLQSEVQVRAALMPINVSKVPVLIKYRTLNVGIGSDMHLDLSAYGHCNYVSTRHACIYFDQYSQIYELINYSEHGTIVDNAVFALNTRPMPQSNNIRGNPAVMSCRDKGKACFCETSIATMLSSGDGCENSAILHHGSYIRMGCLQFVFSVMDYHEGVNLACPRNGVPAAEYKEFLGEVNESSGLKVSVLEAAE